MWKSFAVVAVLAMPSIAVAQSNGCQPSAFAESRAPCAPDASRKAWFARAIDDLLGERPTLTGRSSSGVTFDTKRR